MNLYEKRDFPRNPEHLLRMTQLVAKAGFVVKGRDVAVGESVMVEECTARDLIATGKAERVS